MKKCLNMFEINTGPLVNIIQNNDTNYVVGFIVALLSAKTFQLKEENKFYYDKIQKRDKMVINALFLVSIIVIASFNLVLGIILAILFTSVNL